MKFSIQLKIFLLSSLAISGIAQESISQSDLLFSANPQEICHKRNYPYGSLSIDPGAGISWRWRNGESGTAADFKIGILSVIMHVPVLSGDYNFLYYTRKTEAVSPYFSCGIGAAYIVPYIPLRAGIEFKNGLWI